MVMDDNRTPSWLRMTTGLHYGYGRQPDSIMATGDTPIMDDDSNRTHRIMVTDDNRYSIMVMDDNQTPLWFGWTPLWG